MHKKMNKKKLAIILGLAGAPLAFCTENSVTIPDCGINMADYATAAIAAIGSVVAAVALGYVGFLVIRKGLRWLKTLG